MPKKKKGSGFWRRKGNAPSTGGRARPRSLDSLSSQTDSTEGETTDDNSDTSSIFESACSPTMSESPSGPDPEPVAGHDFVPGPSSQTDDVPLLGGPVVTGISRESDDLAVLAETSKSLSALIPPHWRVIQDREGFHALCFSRKSAKNITIQRVVYASFDGSIDVFVHKKEILGELREDIMKNIVCVPLKWSSLKTFVDNVVRVVLAVRSYEVCAGADLIELQQLWASDNSGKVDDNPYDETRYDRTFRSSECTTLVSPRCWRCHACARVVDNQKRRMKTLLKEEISIKSRNDYLQEDQKKAKLKTLYRDYKNASRNIDHLQSKVSKCMNQGSVNVDPDLGNALGEILRDSNLTPVQQLFLQQQLKSADCKNPKAMRWHPTMIRLALLIKSTSSSAYRALRNSGVICLPGERTLYDYEHAVPRSDGIFTEKLDVLGEKVKVFKEEFQSFHSLLMDEIYISKKLVYRKSDGKLIGYVELDLVESELKNLSESVKSNVQSSSQSEVATKILAYMVKGCTSSVKEVIAAFTTGCLTKDQLFTKTWQVIRACEGVGVKILAVVCDGSSTNRAFIAMHTPASERYCGVLFDTVNMCALDRTLFFISDPPHLLKTIRNCFAKSGTGSKCTRLLTIDGEFILWKTIVKLYEEDIQSTLRRCHKLNSQNVYLNSYSCMKVSYAAQVMSRTVGLDLQSRNWPGTASTVNFILKVNDFFDNLNGAHSNSAKRTANPRLASYCSEDDERFHELKQFGDYIRTWEECVKNLENVSNSQKSKMTLSSQTMEGIYMTIGGFTGAVKYLLSIGAKYVNARAFCQDPLEQYFSKQRNCGGGRNSVSADTFFNNDVKISIHRDLNVHRKSVNISTRLASMEVDEVPLRKRKKT